MVRFFLLIVTTLILFLFPASLAAAKYNAYGLKFYTSETEHFRIHYHAGLEHLIPRVGNQCEKLYAIYKNIFGLTLPQKTEFVVIDGDISNGWAFANTNTITIWTHDFDFNLRGSHDWFEDVVTHEYAHIVSIQTGFKLPAPIPEIRFGFFSHPNEPVRTEVFHSVASDILPHWFTEGIAQYESSVYGTDSWDSHRDMILRSLSLSGKLLSWQNMQVFSGQGDDFEKTYNQGFALVRYIAQKYGADKINALLRESKKTLRMDFDESIKAVFGVSAQKFYEEWRQSMYAHYRQQLDSIGRQVYGKKINKDGYENYWPRFSADDKKIYFLSNGKNDYGFKQLYSASLIDTVKEKDRIKPVCGVHSFYDIDPKTEKICFVSSHSKKSYLPARFGGNITSDLFTDSLPPDKPSFRLFPKKTEKQLTERQSVFSAAFSPDGRKIACAKRLLDRFYLAIADTNGKEFRQVYPPKDAKNMGIGFIYSLDWSPDGKQIAFSFFDQKQRKIALYDTANGSCSVICDTDGDERDPAFSPDGQYLYFSSDRTGIFNLYRYEFSTGKLQQITNVTGGAFAPSISSSGTKVAYAGYSADGYGIYLLDTILVINERTIDNQVVPRQAVPTQQFTTVIGPAQPYSYRPRQYLLVPTILTEQTISNSNNVNHGVSVLKTGLIFNLIEPLTLSNLGNELGGYFLLQPEQLFSFVNFYHQGINIASNYDAGLFGATRLLPFTISGELLLRGIAGKDLFFNETEGEMNNLPYRLDLTNLNLQISHFLEGEYNAGSLPKSQLALHAFVGLNRYDVNLLLSAYNLPVFRYNLGKGYRVGTMGTFGATVIEPDQYICPKGIIAKLQYEMWSQYALNQENSFDPSTQKERYDSFMFHQLTGHAKMGIGIPGVARNALHVDLQARYLSVFKQDTTFPSYYLPGAWIPGYSYYHRETRVVQTAANDSSVQNYDTLTITGRAVVNGELSYRFPLSPKFIDKKFWFFYLERLYGCANFTFGAGFTHPKDFTAFNRNDWLFAYGLEARIEAITFNTYPLAIRFRWDYGADLKAPIGGNKFTFSIAYDFDNWGMVLTPDNSKNCLYNKGL